MATEKRLMGVDREPGDRVVVVSRFPRGFAEKRWLWGGLAVVALVAIGAAVAWLAGDAGSPVTLPSEAPLIKADSEPVKVRPERPGGMEVPNRDKLVYRRLEGLAEPPVVERLLPEPEEPLPPPRPKPAPQTESAPAAAPERTLPSGAAENMVEPPPPATQDKRNTLAAVPPPAKTGAKPGAEAGTKPQPHDGGKPADTAAKPSSAYQIQLVAVRKREQAEGMWNKLKGKHPDVFANLEPNIARADLGKKGVMYRLRAGPIDSEAKARSLCADLGRRKVDCLVVRPGG
jgi:cell division septation protein DedD